MAWQPTENPLERILQELSPCDIVMADIQATTPDQQVNELVQICRELELGQGGLFQ
jgi:hypothetical protein